MQVILGPTVVADKFGPGLNGFKGSIPPLPPPTELTPEWFDAVQMELVNILVSQGIALDGLQFDQIAQALANWNFVGDVLIASGGTLTVDGDATVAAGGTFTCDAGSTFAVNSSTPTFGAFSEVSMLGDVIIGTDDGNMLTVNATSAFQGPVSFIVGQTVTANGPFVAEGTVSINDAMSVLGVNGGSMDSDSAAVMTWNGTASFTSRLRVNSSIMSAVGDFGRSGANMLWYTGTATFYGHTSADGWVKGYGVYDTVAAAPTATADTFVAVAPPVAADLDVHVTCWVQRAVAGDVTVALNEVGGVGQIGTSTDIAAPVTGTSTYQVVSFSRRRVSADTTPRIYQLSVGGNGQNVNLKNVRITVEPVR